MENRPQLIKELARIFNGQAEAEAVLANAGFPRNLAPNWGAHAYPELYWERVLTDVENGRIADGGPELLAAAARAQYPGNTIFREAAEHIPEPVPDTVVRTVDTGATARTEAGRTQTGTMPRQVETTTTWPTVIFRGAERYDDFIRIARGAFGPQAQILYAAATEAAVLLPGHRATAAGHEYLMQQLRQGVEALDRDDPEAPAIEVEFNEYPYRPQVIPELRCVGPDQQVFIAENVPNTTPVRDIPRAVLGEYGTAMQADRFGRTRRTVVDRVVPPRNPDDPPQEERLNPDHTLAEAGVQEGDELHIRPESTAGQTRLRLAALHRVRNEIQEYEDQNDNFTVVYRDDDLLPTAYEIEFSAPGFAPPPRRDLPPEKLEPVDQDTHRVALVLHGGFPIQAPGVLFTSPVFHPNITPPEDKVRPPGFVCIGALGDSYRPDLDFYELCQLITDIAGYRNYGAIPHGVLDAHGFLDRDAADWARTEVGQQRILARGGRSLTDLLGLDEAPPPLPLRIRRLATKPEPSK